MQRSFGSTHSISIHFERRHTRHSVRNRNDNGGAFEAIVDDDEKASISFHSPSCLERTAPECFVGTARAPQEPSIGTKRGTSPPPKGKTAARRIRIRAARTTRATTPPPGPVETGLYNQGNQRFFVVHNNNNTKPWSQSQWQRRSDYRRGIVELPPGIVFGNDHAGKPAHPAAFSGRFRYGRFRPLGPLQALRRHLCQRPSELEFIRSLSVEHLPNGDGRCRQERIRPRIPGRRSRKYRNYSVLQIRSIVVLFYCVKTLFGGFLSFFPHELLKSLFGTF